VYSQMESYPKQAKKVERPYIPAGGTWLDEAMGAMDDQSTPEESSREWWEAALDVLCCDIAHRMSKSEDPYLQAAADLFEVRDSPTGALISQWILLKALARTSGLDAE
jgi:hypothetical protein